MTQQIAPSLGAFLAYCAATTGATPTIGPSDAATERGTDLMRWSLFADATMTKSIEVVEVTLKDLREWVRYTMSTSDERE